MTTKDKENNRAEGGLADARVFDRRTVERNIKRGAISRKDYEKHLKALVDGAEKIKSSDS